MRIGILHSRVRVAERLLVEACEARGIGVEPVDVREVGFDLHDPGPWARFDVVFERCVSQAAALAAVTVLEGYGVPVVNTSGVVRTCGDNLATSVALMCAGADGL
ncbi:MAG: hypothetical protein IT433_09940 [Phycisphaerales bacterium]|nr:hypothetical protein [Phycisphaerales bacterium]